MPHHCDFSIGLYLLTWYVGHETLKLATETRPRRRYDARPRPKPRPRLHYRPACYTCYTVQDTQSTWIYSPACILSYCVHLAQSNMCTVRFFLYVYVATGNGQWHDSVTQCVTLLWHWVWQIMHRMFQVERAFSVLFTCCRLLCFCVSFYEQTSDEDDKCDVLAFLRKTFLRSVQQSLRDVTNRSCRKKA